MAAAAAAVDPAERIAREFRENLPAKG